MRLESITTTRYILAEHFVVRFPSRLRSMGDSIDTTTYPHEFHGDQLEALLFEALDDLADESPLDTVRLDHDEGTFLVGGHGC